jgi:hypothetical protein
MPRHRTYSSDAARQAAYRERAATKRKRHVTNPESLREIVERISFIRDVAGAVARDNIANWKGWPGSEQLRSFALQTDLDDLVSRLDALIHGDRRPFDGAEFHEWRAKRERENRKN